MLVHRPLGPARRSRGVDHVRQVVGAQTQRSGIRLLGCARRSRPSRYPAQSPRPLFRVSFRSAALASAAPAGRHPQHVLQPLAGIVRIQRHVRPAGLSIPSSPPPSPGCARRRCPPALRSDSRSRSGNAPADWLAVQLRIGQLLVLDTTATASGVRATCASNNSCTHLSADNVAWRRVEQPRRPDDARAPAAPTSASAGVCGAPSSASDQRLQRRA